MITELIIPSETNTTKKDESMPSAIPSGNKSNTTFFIRRTHFELGPGSLVDDKQPYGGKHGARVYAYQLRYNQFKKAISKNISQRKGSFTYKKDGQTHVCNENWIILWQAYHSQVNNNVELKRSVTYFVTKNPEYIWMNKIALVEYTGIDNQKCQDPLRKVRRKFRPDREKGVNPERKQTGINDPLEEYTGIDEQECQNNIQAVGSDRNQRLNPGSKHNGINEGELEYTGIADEECKKNIGVIEQKFRPERDDRVNSASKQTGIDEDLQEYTEIDDGECQNHVIGQHFSNKRDHEVNPVSKKNRIMEDTQNYAQKYADEERRSHLRTIRRSKGYQRVSPGSNQIEINENAQEYTEIDEEMSPNHLQEIGQYFRNNRDHGVTPVSKQTKINEDTETEGKDSNENACKNCVKYLKSYFEISEENKRLKADVEKLKNNRQTQYDQFQEEIRILKEKLKSSQNFPVHEEAKFSCNYNDSDGSIVVKNEPPFAIHEKKEDYHCYVCKINFQTKGTLDFHNQSLHGKNKSENLYFASKRKSAEIMETPFVFPLAKNSKEDIPANQRMIKNSSHILNTHRTRNHKSNKEDSQIFSGKKKMGPKETKSYPERENENEFQNQNSCFDIINKPNWVKICNTV